MKRSEIATFLKEMNESFASQMSGLPIKKKALEDMKAGFSDGARITLMSLIEKGHIKVED